VVWLLLVVVWISLKWRMGVVSHPVA